MPTKSKEQPTADKSTTPKKTQAKSTAQKTTRKKALPKATAKKTAEQLPQEPAAQQPLIEAPTEAPTETAPTAKPMQTKLAGMAVGGEVSFAADALMPGDIWSASSAIPTLDEATYAAQKAQAEAQRRAIEVASLNLKNINDLHELERQSIEAAIGAKTNETRNAQLTAAGIDYQTQLEMNGEKSQHLSQAAAKHQAASRETGYADQLIALKDQNFELEIQQAQNVFADKAARYRAQLTGQ